MSEWGNPLRKEYPITEYIGVRERTQGTEISQYLEEKKSTEIPLVVTSERGPAQKSMQVLAERSGKAGHRR